MHHAFAGFVAAALVALSSCRRRANAPERPKITGISHLAVYTSDPAATEHYYADIIGAAKEPDPENPQGVRYAVSATQFVEVLPLPPNAGINRLDHAAWNTDERRGNAEVSCGEGMEDAGGKVTKGSDGSRWFEVLDPEGNKVQFVQPPANAKAPDAPNVIGHHIIHVGFLVHDRAKEDTFYRDLLGFRPYWYGGMNDDKVDWVSQQAPDGHDWLEYMLTSGPSGSGIPANISQQHSRRAGPLFDRRNVGGRCATKCCRPATGWRQTRRQRRRSAKMAKGSSISTIPMAFALELMNFHATEKPCCSAFTADDPAEYAAE